MAQYRQTAEELEVHLSGRLDTTACLDLEKEIHARVEQAGLPVVFDMQEVTYVSSAFLRICLTVGKQVGFDRFRVANLRPELKRIFKIAGFDQMMRTG